MRRQHGSKTHEKGVVVIEFALVFTIIFTVFWGLVSYMFPLVLTQAMHRSVAESARLAALVPVITSAVHYEDYDDAREDYEEAVKAVVAVELKRQIEGMNFPARWTQPIVDNIAVSPPVFSGGRLEITLVYPNYAINPIVPIIHLPGIGAVPRVPTDLKASASMSL